MGDTPFIKFYPSDFLGGVGGLSPAERGTYITLLCLIYEAGQPIPRDDARLSRRCGAPKAAFRRMLEALLDQGKITETDGMLSNRRAEKALMDRTNRTQNATHAAHQKWSAQRQKTKGNQQGNDAGAMPPQCVADASQSPEARRKESSIEDSQRKRRKPRKPEVELPEGWVPNAKNIEDALFKGLKQPEIENEAHQFRDHHHAKGSVFRDWDAAWRKWCANAVKFRRHGPLAGRSGSTGMGGIAGAVARRRDGQG
ncbi:YdaU family protein [Salibaculum sp.]|uniref:YdaU family protein n=1 Tax=Salibaculum sp. TaxID=2855480 RepID=UPI002B489CBF|nr:YdaU family protein [Salibaculum sp.]HKL70863.1 YdaU family protein [Salibaculum sp.]